MKKYLLSITAALVFLFPTHADELERGYRGFLDWDTDFFFSEYNSYTPSGYEHHKEIEADLGVITSHGFQFNKHFFLGGGLGYEISTDSYRHTRIPVFVHGRTDWTLKGFPVYADLRIGAMLSGGETDRGLFVSPTVGYRWDWGKSICANFGVGVIMHCVNDWSNHYTWHPRPAFRFGIEF